VNTLLSPRGINTLPWRFYLTTRALGNTVSLLCRASLRRRRGYDQHVVLLLAPSSLITIRVLPRYAYSFAIPKPPTFGAPCRGLKGASGSSLTWPTSGTSTRGTVTPSWFELRPTPTAHLHPTSPASRAALHPGTGALGDVRAQPLRSVWLVSCNATGLLTPTVMPGLHGSTSSSTSSAPTLPDRFNPELPPCYDGSSNPLEFLQLAVYMRQPSSPRYGLMANWFPWPSRNRPHAWLTNLRFLVEGSLRAVHHQLHCGQRSARHQG
jgi:hypothetical protein